MVRKRTTKKTTKDTESKEGGEPVDLVQDVEDETPIVSEPPVTPEEPPSDGDKQESPEVSEKPKRKYTRRSPKLSEAEQAKQDQDKAIGTMLAGMQFGLCTKFGGDIWAATEEEKQALTNAYINMLGRFDVLPWWVEFVLAQSAYFGPRIVLLQMKRRAQMQAERNAAAESQAPGYQPVEPEPQPTVNEHGQLAPMGA